MKRIIILAGGNITGFNDYDINKDYVICVDKGINFAIQNNIKIDFALGDFDSVSIEHIDYIKNNVLFREFNINKDKTDLELALDYCVENNYKYINIYGATGTRLDHSLANIFLLKRFQNQLKIILIDENNEIRYINKNTKIESTYIESTDKKYISVLPTNDKCIFSIDGVKWPLVNHELKYGSTYTISNEKVSDIYIEIFQGDLYLIMSRD